MTLRDEHRGKLVAALRYADPERWREVVRAALDRFGSVPEAAEELGIAERTLRYWVAGDPMLTAGIKIRPQGQRKSY